MPKCVCKPQEGREHQASEILNHECYVLECEC
jgi:hypothetical protein